MHSKKHVPPAILPQLEEDKEIKQFADCMLFLFFVFLKKKKTCSFRGMKHPGYTCNPRSAKPAANDPIGLTFTKRKISNYILFSPRKRSKCVVVLLRINLPLPQTPDPGGLSVSSKL
jgi:hypothetical protein